MNLKSKKPRDSFRNLARKIYLYRFIYRDGLSNEQDHT
jgi:hypothetical protein